MLNIIACHQIAYQNDHFCPNTFFTIADTAGIQHNAGGVMASSMFGHYYRFTEDTPVLNDPNDGHHRFLFGAYQHDVVGTNEQLIANVIRNNGVHANVDVPIYVLDKNYDGVLMVYTGRLNEMGDVEIHKYMGWNNQWVKCPENLEVFYTLSPLVKELKFILGKRLRKCSSIENKETLQLNRTKKNAADKLEKIRLLQAQDKATSGL